MSRRAVVSVVAVVLFAGIGVGLALFQPWRLVTTRTANDTHLVPALLGGLRRSSTGTIVKLGRNASTGLGQI
jgi:hypothetical protein